MYSNQATYISFHSHTHTQSLYPPYCSILRSYKVHITYYIRLRLVGFYSRMYRKSPDILYYNVHINC